MEKQWLSVYIYYEQPWEQLLVEAVNPFIKKLIKNKSIDQYFFIRYFERGPHIRLRLKGNREVLESVVKPSLDTYFNDYFTKHPSERKAKHDVSYAWLPNNSLHYITYEPEYDRYGGSDLIELAEQHFQNSSNAVMSILQAHPNITYTEKLTAALQLQLAYGARLVDRNRRVAFFQFLNNHRLHNKEALKTRLHEHFMKQQESVTHNTKDTWTQMTAEHTIMPTWLKIWLNSLKSLKINLNTKTINKTIKVPACEFIKPMNAEQQQEARLWHIFDSYIHMTNNRLGVRNEDEPMITYFITKSLEGK